MSGSGGGGGGDFQVPVADCAKLRFDTHVASPVAAVLPGLRVDEVLDVALQSQNGTAVVVALTKGGQRVGGIASPNVTRLRGCLDDGFHFQAVIREINGAQVKVHVEPAP